MSTELYTVIILIMFFGTMFLTMIFSIHFEDVLIYLMSGLISCVIASIAVIPVMSFDVFSHTSSISQISVQEISKISPKDNSDALFNVTYTDTEDINRKITVKEIVYDSDTTYIEKARKTFLFLYEDSYVLHEPQEFMNINLFIFIGIIFCFITMLSLIYFNGIIGVFLTFLIACLIYLPTIALNHANSNIISQISVQEINNIEAKNNSDTFYNVTYTDTDENRKKVTVKEIAYDSDITYIEKTRKTYLFLYEDNYILYQQP